MRWRNAWVLMRKDLDEFKKQKFLIGSIIGLPVFLGIIMPILTIYPVVALIPEDGSWDIPGLVEEGSYKSGYRPVFTNMTYADINIEGQGQDKPVTVWVKDTGIGIDAEDMKHVFQKYYRPRRPSEEHKAGLSLGLGLYICAKFLRSMGGDIWVEKTTPNR